MLKKLPPQTLNSIGHNQIYGPNASMQPVPCPDVVHFGTTREALAEFLFFTPLEDRWKRIEQFRFVKPSVEVVHLNQNPFPIRNHTISAAFRAHCERSPGREVNLTATLTADDPKKQQG